MPILAHHSVIYWIHCKWGFAALLENKYRSRIIAKLFHYSSGDNMIHPASNINSNASFCSVLGKPMEYGAANNDRIEGSLLPRA